MKKGDVIIIISIALATIIGIAAIFVFSGEGSTVTIKQNNETVYSGSLYKDNEVSLSTNTVVIKNGEVYMRDATCKNQVCVKHSKISSKGESIICLPNRVIAEIN